jgi:hypothetical protein
MTTTSRECGLADVDPPAHPVPPRSTASSDAKWFERAARSVRDELLPAVAPKDARARYILVNVK